jgi:hypothetical protein
MSLNYNATRLPKANIPANKGGVKGKGKVPHEDVLGSQGIDPRILNFGTR